MGTQVMTANRWITTLSCFVILCSNQLCKAAPNIWNFEDDYDSKTTYYRAYRLKLNHIAKTLPILDENLQTLMSEFSPDEVQGNSKILDLIGLRLMIGNMLGEMNPPKYLQTLGQEIQKFQLLTPPQKTIQALDAHMHQMKRSPIQTTLTRSELKSRERMLTSLRRFFQDIFGSKINEPLKRNSLASSAKPWMSVI